MEASIEKTIQLKFNELGPSSNNKINNTNKKSLIKQKDQSKSPVLISLNGSYPSINILSDKKKKKQYRFINIQKVTSSSGVENVTPSNGGGGHDAILSYVINGKKIKVQSKNMRSTVNLESVGFKR